MWLFNKKESLSDEELVEQYYRSGDKSFVGELFEKHVQTVYGVCHYYFSDRDTAQEMVMQIFEKLLKELKQREIRNFRGWLSFVVRNHCLNAIKKQKSGRWLPESYLEFEIREPELEEEERIAAVTEDGMLEKLNEVLPKLNEKQQLCIRLFYLDGLSYEQVSSQTGYTIKEVKSYIQNGKRNLKLMISANFNSNEAA